MEIEAKIKVQAHPPVRSRLTALGARFVGHYREVNHIFEHAALGLRAAGQALRVREQHTLEGQAQPATITYKGPIVPGEVFKTRPEIEISTPDAGAALELFEGLGFECLLSFEKTRETWSHAGCLVELDEVPHLGCFLEVEGPDARTIAAVLADLGHAGSAHISRSYVGMLLGYCESAGLPERHIRFDD